MISALRGAGGGSVARDRRAYASVLHTMTDFRTHPTPSRNFRFFRFGLLVCTLLLPGVRAEMPALLARAFQQWAAGREDLAFTQHTRIFHDDGTVKSDRIERYDPSLPDNRRWRLLEVDGWTATDAQREKWDTKKNGRSRKSVVKSPAEYLDLEHARQVSDTPTLMRFEIGLRREAARLLAVENIAVYVTVDKESARIARIAAKLREPIRVLLGLARITGLDLDVRIEAGDQIPSAPTGEVQAGSSARVAMSKLGSPMEYTWSDFKRVTSFAEAQGP